MTASVYWFICTRQAYPAALPRMSANQAAFNRAAANSIAGVLKARHGVGDMLARPISKPIADHLLCDGTAISRLAFPQLFAEIGEAWGAGDGSTTFNLPNLINVVLPVPPTAPPQVITGTTVGDGTPGSPSTTSPGGGDGGDVNTGGRPDRPRQFPGTDIP